MHVRFADILDNIQVHRNGCLLLSSKMNQASWAKSWQVYCETACAGVDEHHLCVKGHFTFHDVHVSTEIDRWLMPAGTNALMLSFV